jgi:hypothetical protein
VSGREDVAVSNKMNVDKYEFWSKLYCFAEINFRVIFVETAYEIVNQIENRDRNFSLEQCTGGKWKGISFHCTGISQFVCSMSVRVMEQ